jgi:hypothetical protein
MNLMRIAVASSAALLAAACGSYDWHGEAFKNYYAQPSRETGQELEERQAIMHWKADPKQKKRIGYLEKYAIRLEGSREPHDIFYIKDPSGRFTLGYISENGALFKYTKDGQAERLGEYPIYDVGIRVFYNLPKGDNIAFEDIAAFVPD